VKISPIICTALNKLKSSKMKKDIVLTDLMPLIENSKVDLRIKSARLLPHSESRLDSMKMKFNPISDTDIPYRDLTSSDTKRNTLRQLIDKLNVIKNIRYQRTIEDTYCNVYSYDYCFFSKVYLPTIWWTEDSLEKILAGQEVEAIYGETVEPIYSSAIHDWFLQWGASFGWKRMTDLDEIQNKVNNEGGVAIICSKRKKRGLSGHIVPIVPETSIKKAYRENGVVVYPLQSQAGKLNYNYFSKARKDWWNHERYSSFVIYYHD
jgi:hypothetical protein